jgi:hypothetical protein
MGGGGGGSTSWSPSVEDAEDCRGGSISGRGKDGSDSDGGAAAVPQFHEIEKMFQQPIVFSSLHASTAVLRMELMADGIQGSKRLLMIFGYTLLEGRMYAKHWNSSRNT